MIAPMSSSTMPPDALPNGSVMPSPADTLPPVLSEGLEVSVTIPDLPGSDVIARGRAAARAVDLVVQDAHASIPGWDNLAMVDAFARAAERAREVLRTSTHPIERRLVGSRLLRLVPPALLPAGQRDRAVALSLADAVLQRADNDFALVADDAPHIHPSWTAFLTRAGIVDDVLRVGRHDHLLAPRSLSPFDAVGSNVLVRVVAGSGSDGALALEILGTDGEYRRRRRTSDGKDAGPAELRPDVLISWVKNGGTGGRGLDLRRPEDRCLLLAFSETLRERKLDLLLARAAGDDGERRAAVISAVVDAAADAVAFAALDPLACRFVFPVSPDAPWVERALSMLTGLGLVAEVSRRAPAARPTREVVWLDAVVDNGFVGGAMSAVSQARAFSRLAVSMLAPLGALVLGGARGGDGVVVTLLEEDHDGARQRGPLWVSPSRAQPVVALAQAWQAGVGRILPTPTAETAHDLQALPAWWQSFAETIADLSPATDIVDEDSAPMGGAVAMDAAADANADANDDDTLELDVELEVIDDDAIIAAVATDEGDAVNDDAADNTVDVEASTLRPTRHSDVDGSDHVSDTNNEPTGSQ